MYKYPYLRDFPQQFSYTSPASTTKNPLQMITKVTLARRRRSTGRIMAVVNRFSSPSMTRDPQSGAAEIVVFEVAFADTQQESEIVGCVRGKNAYVLIAGKVEEFEEITITKHGAPVAKLVPIRKEASLREHLAAIELIQRFHSSIFLAD